MPYRLPKGFDENKLPPVRWRRGDIVDVDTEYRKALLRAGAEAVNREEAAEVIVDKKKAEKPEPPEKPVKP